MVSIIMDIQKELSVSLQTLHHLYEHDEKPEEKNSVSTKEKTKF